MGLAETADKVAPYVLFPAAAVGGAMGVGELMAGANRLVTGNKATPEERKRRRLMSAGLGGGFALSQMTRELLRNTGKTAAEEPSMTDRQMFKAALLNAWAEKGMTPAQMAQQALQLCQQIEKTGNIWGMAKDLTGTVANVAKPFGTAALLGGLLIPPAIGAAGGVAASAMTDTDDRDVEDLQVQERIEHLRQLTDQARQSSAQRRKRQAKPLPYSRY